MLRVSVIAFLLSSTRCLAGTVASPEPTWSEISGDCLVTCQMDGQSVRSGVQILFADSQKALSAVIAARGHALTVSDRAGRELARFKGLRLCSLPLVLRFDAGRLSVGCEGRWVLHGLELAAVSLVGFSGDPERLAFRVQPLADPWMEDDFMRSEGETGSWEIGSGAWDVAQPSESEYSVNAFCVRGQGNREARYLTGYPFWDRLEAQCSLKRKGGAAGLLFGVDGPGGGAYGLRLDGEEGEGELSLWSQDRGGWRRVKAVKTAGWIQEWQELRLALKEDGIQAWVDGQSCLEWRSDRILSGRVGLWASEEPCLFDDFKVGPLGSDFSQSVHQLKPKAFSASFFQDPLMQRWSREESFWERSPGGGLRHSGLISAPYRLLVDLPASAQEGQWTELSGEAEDGAKTWLCRIERIGSRWTIGLGTPDGQTGRLDLDHPSGQVPIAVAPTAVEVGPAGQAAHVSLQGTACRIGMAGPLDLRSQIVMAGERIRDYTFSASPSE